MALSQTTITSIASLFTALLVVWTAYKTKQLQVVADSTKKTVDAVHTLSNSAMGATLKMNVQLAASNAVMAHRLAEITGQPGDAAAAVALDLKTKEHQAIYEAHLAQQAKVDAAAAAGTPTNA
jgi:hypothetical protein